MFVALHTHYTITRTLFTQIGGLQTNVCAFATPDKPSALYLYANKPKQPKIYTPLNSFFLHLKQLTKQAIWFNPPYPLIVDTLTALAHVHSQAPHHTYMLGIIPYLPQRQWYKTFIGPDRLFHLKYKIDKNTHCIVSCGTKNFLNCDPKLLL